MSWGHRRPEQAIHMLFIYFEDDIDPIKGHVKVIIDTMLGMDVNNLKTLLFVATKL